MTAQGKTENQRKTKQKLKGVGSQCQVLEQPLHIPFRLINWFPVYSKLRRGGIPIYSLSMSNGKSSLSLEEKRNLTF